jgi:hypothetical protein
LNGISEWHKICVALKLILNYMFMSNFIKIKPNLHPPSKSKNGLKLEFDPLKVIASELGPLL